MTPEWKKLGRIFCPEQLPRHLKLQTHAANPLALHLFGDVYRIFFSARDAKNRSSVGAIDFDIKRQTVLAVLDRPLFEHGKEGTFFSEGVSVGNIFAAANGKKYMLFMGWKKPASQHWFGTIGCLEVMDDFSLKLSSALPLLDLSTDDPISLSYPWVMPDDSGGYLMWYGSTNTWDGGNGEMIHVIKYARSIDGIHWIPQGTAIPFKVGKAQAFSRPTVIKSELGYEMWFSFRSGDGTPYRIGYAKSRDGLKWELDLAAAGIGVSSSGWDSEMIEYPFVFQHAGETYMLYNGNAHGLSGFGLAVRHRS